MATLFCSICALVGAIKYKVTLVSLNTLCYLGRFLATTVISIRSVNEITTVLAGSSTNVFVAFDIVTGAMVAALFVYPHIGFMGKMKDRIMSSFLLLGIGPQS